MKSDCRTWGVWPRKEELWKGLELLRIVRDCTVKNGFDPYLSPTWSYLKV